jgi:hypothetical protein
VNNNYTDYHVAASVIADAVSLLSNGWNDLYSFNHPHNLNNTGTPGRDASDTWYRLAIISGKGQSFPYISAPSSDFGSDGGVHNFFRYLENWSGNQLNFLGSIVSLYYNRQGIGVFKTGATVATSNVYAPPTRGYNFDVEFLEPTLLPPETPMFRDVNITGFTRILQPND